MVIADLVLINGNIITVDKGFSIKEAVAVRNGRIIDVDDNDAIMKKVSRDTKVIDLDGKTVLPAAGDAHMHAVSTGLLLRDDFVDFKNAKSLRDINDLISEAILKVKPGEWIFGSGIQEYSIVEFASTERSLTCFDLDAVSPDNPVAVMDSTLHVLIVNSKALEITGFANTTKELPVAVEEGLIGRDDRGFPNGRFEEYEAQNLIGKHIPTLTDEQLEDCIVKMQHLLNEQGITHHCDVLGVGGEYVMLGTWGERPIHIYEALSAAGKLTARVNINYFAAKDGIHTYDSIISGVQTPIFSELSDEKWVRMKSVKLFGDKMDIWKDKGIGCSMFSGVSEDRQIAEIERTVIELHRRGFQILTHAIGSKMVDVITGAYVKAQEMYPREDPRHFIIHGDGITEENIEEMVKHKIGISAQPISFPVLIDINEDASGQDIFNWQMYIDEGIIVSGGSDYSSSDSWSDICTNPVSWLEGLQHAMVRDTLQGDVVMGDLGISIEDGIRMFTINAARQNHAENWLGSIEVGKVADMQILGRDILSVEKNEIGSIPIDMTICDGKIVYERN